MSDYAIHGDDLTAIANAIRLKTGSSALLEVDQFATAIATIPSGGSLPSGSFTGNDSTEYSIDTGYTNAKKILVQVDEYSEDTMIDIRAMAMHLFLVEDDIAIFAYRSNAEGAYKALNTSVYEISSDTRFSCADGIINVSGFIPAQSGKLINGVKYSWKVIE